jgi:hypothetical protein
MSISYEQARAVADHIRDNDHPVWVALRQFAARRLEDEYRERGIKDADIGSSDVSISLVEALRWYEVPLVGPVVRAYQANGFSVPQEA